MLLDELQQAEKRSVGLNQAIKAVNKANATKVFVAEDADPRVTAELIALCQKNEVELIVTGTMVELGKACGIHVKAAAAVILKN